MAKLTFLGTAGDSATLARQRRSAGGFILKLEGGQYHVDPGPGALMAAAQAKVAPRETIAVMASNNAIITSQGLNSVIDAMTLSGSDRFGVLLCSHSVRDGTESEIPVLRKDCASWVERVVTFDETTRIGINYLNIFPRKAEGLDPTGLAFRFETADLIISYTGDTGWFDGIADEHTGCDVLIVRCKNPAGVQEPGALNVDDAIKLLSATQPRIAYLTGFGSKLLDSSIIDVARHIQRESKVQTIAAKDGQEVSLAQYAGKGKR